jgi:hypothetical protein
MKLTLTTFRFFMVQYRSSKRIQLLRYLRSYYVYVIHTLKVIGRRKMAMAQRY